MLVTLLVTAMAVQGAVAQVLLAGVAGSGGGRDGSGGGQGRVTLIELLGGARTIVRRLHRQELKPARNLRSLSARLTLRRLRLLVARLLDQAAPPMEFSPFLFRLPPPVAPCVA